MNGRAVARSGEWAQHFSNASCFMFSLFVFVDLCFVDSLVVDFVLG